MLTAWWETDKKVGDRASKLNFENETNENGMQGGESTSSKLSEKFVTWMLNINVTLTKTHHFESTGKSHVKLSLLDCVTIESLTGVQLLRHHYISQH